ncbi:MAG TPA: HU family DNA-binding protein [Thermotogota bacterium]|nr:HU family DNA-binding protein [Thermotogota bacterium]HRW92234.1 HU family DNA-binding protein [Thermotogota bacterium]
MNKKELIEAIAKETGETQKLSERFLSAAIQVISHELSNGGDVRLVGFGTFKVAERKARKGVNPKTMKPIDIPATKVPKFVPGKELKEKVS